MSAMTCLVSRHIFDNVFFFSSRRRHTRLQGDWSSDVCSSDLQPQERTRRLIDRATKRSDQDDSPYVRQHADVSPHGSFPAICGLLEEASVPASAPRCKVVGSVEACATHPAESSSAPSTLAIAIYGKLTNRSLKSVAFAASPSSGVTPDRKSTRLNSSH